MALHNRARMTTATTGTGTLTLGSAVAGFQSFADSGVVDGEQFFYAIEDGADWEYGIGTYTASGTTMARSVLESSNADAALDLSGTAEVFIDAPARKLQWTQIGQVATTSGTTWDFTSIPKVYDDLLVVVDGLSHVTGSPNFRLAISPDGSSYSGVATLLGGLSAANTYSASIWIPRYNGNVGSMLRGLLDSTVGSSPSLSVVAAVNPVQWRCTGGIQALRFSIDGGTGDGGTITLYGK